MTLHTVDMITLRDGVAVERDRDPRPARIARSDRPAPSVAGTRFVRIRLRRLPPERSQPTLRDGAVTVEQGRSHTARPGPTTVRVVFVHGAFVDGTLWRKVTPTLDDALRCVVPDLPLGSHHTPMKPGADLSPPGLAKLIADFVAALEIDDVTLIGNDTGGALCQIVVTAPSPADRTARADACDAYENFLPSGVPIPAGRDWRGCRAASA